MTSNADEGVAALELAIFLPLFIALIGFVAPMAYLLYEELQLGRTAGDVVRFASSRTDVDRIVAYGGTELTVPAGELPSGDATALETQRAYTGVGGATLTGQSRGVATGTGCPSGYRVYITLTTTVDLGPFAGFLYGVAGPTKTLTAQATSCEE